MTVETRIEKSAPPTRPSQVLLGLIVRGQRVTAHAAADDQGADVVGHGGDDRPEQEGDAVAVGEHRRGEEQAGVGAEQRDPADGQQGRRRPGHRRAPLDPEQVPEQGEGGDQHQDQRERRDPLVVGTDHQGDGPHQAEQGGRVVAGPTQHAEALAGGEGDHHEAQDQRGDGAQLEGQQGDDGHGDAGSDPEPDRAAPLGGRSRRAPRSGAERRTGGPGRPPPVGVRCPGGRRSAPERSRSVRPDVSAGDGARRRPPPRWRRCRRRRTPVAAQSGAGSVTSTAWGSPSRWALRSAAASPATPPRLRPAPGTSVTDAPGGSAARGCR